MTQQNSSLVALTVNTEHTDKILHEHLGLNTSQFVLGIMVVFILASLSLSWADSLRQSRLHRAAVRIITVSVSLACAVLLTLNYGK